MATIIINKTPVEYMNTEFDLFSLILLFDWSFENEGVLSMKSSGNDLWFVFSGFRVWYGVYIGNREWWGVCSGKRDWGGVSSWKRLINNKKEKQDLCQLCLLY